jgi:antitoxin Phd
MPSYSLTQLGNKSGEITEAAFQGPVDITDRGKRKFVLLTAADYDRMRNALGQRAVHVDDLSEDAARRYIEALALTDG